MSGERSEQATAQRKRKAQEKGDRVRSREFISAFAMLAGSFALGTAAIRFADAWHAAFGRMLDLGVRSEWTSQTLLALARSAFGPVLAPIGIILAAAFGAALFCGVAQSGGVHFSASAIGFKGERLNPATNIKQLFSMRSLVRLGKSLLPAAVVGAMCTRTVRDTFLATPVMSMARLPLMLEASYHLTRNTAWVLLAWSGFDYAMEYRSWQGRLRMTKQEVREEMRDSNGNPQIKGRMRQIQRAMAKRRTKADVSRASVLIMNPTHFAVALEFSFETMQAPKVLAKGRDLIAIEMREQARWAGVPIIENPPLARSLYRSVAVGQSIPFELYTAVAAVLAYLYRQEVEQAQRRSAFATQHAGGNA